MSLMNFLLDNTETIKSAGCKAALVVKKYSPEILTAAGIVATGAGTVLACKATLKAAKVVKEHKEKMAEIEEAREIVVAENCEEEYPAEAAKIEAVQTCVKTIAKITKIYAIPVALIIGGMSFCCISTGISRRRNIALGAAYAAVDAAFKAYRARIREKYGVEADEEAKYGVKRVTGPSPERPEIGEDLPIVHEKQTEIDVYANDLYASEWAKIYDKDNSTQYTGDKNYDLWFIRCQENALNMKLKCKGYLFLNDVYDALGLKETRAGQMVGWLWHPGLKPEDLIRIKAMVIHPSAGPDMTGNSWAINKLILDFNPHGNILNCI